MEERLSKLYALQKIDKGLDELEDLKGDLPMAVAELEARVRMEQDRLKELEAIIKQAQIDRDKADLEIITLAERIEKFKAQQFQVKSNRQYDALSREIDTAQAMITQLEKEMDAIEGKIAVAREDMEKGRIRLEEATKELEEKRQELDEVSKANEDEELHLKHNREKVLRRISKEDYAVYERIRKAKNGIAVVPVKRNACGGCYHFVPPQKLLELRQNDRIYTCENCGRILVSDEVVARSATVV